MIQSARSFEDDFLQGQRDCQNGIPHKSLSEEYDRGYAAQYELEQVQTEITLHQGNKAQTRGKDHA